MTCVCVRADAGWLSVTMYTQCAVLHGTFFTVCRLFYLA